MAKLKVNGHELVVKTVSKSRVRDVAELQRQSGMAMAEIREAVEEADILGNAVASFLSQHNAGFTTVKWNELLDGSLEDLGAIVPEPGDEGYESEDEAEANPPAE